MNLSEILVNLIVIKKIDFMLLFNFQVQPVG